MTLIFVTIIIGLVTHLPLLDKDGEGEAEQNATRNPGDMNEREVREAKMLEDAKEAQKTALKAMRGRASFIFDGLKSGAKDAAKAANDLRKKGLGAGTQPINVKHP